MSKRSARRSKANLEARIRDYESLRNPKGYKRPGSRSARKNAGGVTARRRK